MTEVCRMTSVIELSTSIGPSGMLRNTTATADATLDEIEAELVATYVARTQRPSADGIKLFSDRSVEDKLRICQDETAVAAARMLQVQAESNAEPAALRCRETAAEQQIVLHQRDTARLQRMLSASTAGRLSTPALLTFMRDICRSRSAMATALHVDMQKLEPPKDKGANAGESGPLPVHIEKARIEHAQAQREDIRLMAEVAQRKREASAAEQALADAHNEVERLQREDQADNRTIDELGYQTVKCKAVCASTAAVIAEETKRRRSLQQRAMDAEDRPTGRECIEIASELQRLQKEQKRLQQSAALSTEMKPPPLGSRRMMYNQ